MTASRSEEIMRTQEQEMNEAAFRRLEDRIKQSYPYGQFVALMGGEIVADAADFDELDAKLEAAGCDPFDAFVIQAGHHYPRHAIIF
jgi:hypothetical protein